MKTILNQAEQREAENIIETLNLLKLTPEQKAYISGIIGGFQMAESVRQEPKAS